jgi:carbamoyl-phosphate synthase large subunit
VATQKDISVLFLGAAKRVSLLERFVAAAWKINVGLQMFSCEASSAFYPISHLACVLAGPSFTAPEFQQWMADTVRRHSIDIVIPNMDSATVALSLYQSQHREQPCWAVVSDHGICEIMNDKVRSSEFFRSAGIPCLPNTPDRYPKLLKPRFGFGSKGIRVIHSSSQLAGFLQKNDPLAYEVQDLIEDFTETTVDLYVSRTGSLIGYVLRDRMEVSDGEVMVCRTRDATQDEAALIEKVAASAKWQGCITLQYMTSRHGRYVVEINPRFGGGATCGIEAGLDMPLYILSEFLGEPITPPRALKKLTMSRARRDFFYEHS